MNKKIAVIYKSKTGFTKKYAEMIADEIDCTLIDYKEITVKIMSDFNIIVFGSRVHAGFIDGYKNIREMFLKSTAEKFVLFATGATPNEAEDDINEVWKNNLSADELNNIPHFYMQSGLCYEKMGFVDKTMMKMMSAILKNKKDKDDSEKGFEKAIASSYDISSKEYIEHLIDYLGGELSD